LRFQIGDDFAEAEQARMHLAAKERLILGVSQMQQNKSFFICL
jgi:hypothetical protein